MSLTSMNQALIADETTRALTNPGVNNSATTSTRVLNEMLKIEECASRLRSQLIHVNTRLPSLQLQSTNMSNELIENDDSTIRTATTKTPTSKIDYRNIRSPPTSAKMVRQVVDSSELVSSSLLSSAASSSNADLSEDEQINYYNDDDDEEEEEENNNNNEYSGNMPSNMMSSNNRSLSTSSDQTLVLMNNNTNNDVTTPRTRVKDEQYSTSESSRELAYETEEEVRIKPPAAFHHNNELNRSRDLDQSVVIKLNRLKVDEQANNSKPNTVDNLISIKINPAQSIDDLEPNRNDLSDDEVKEYDAAYDDDEDEDERDEDDEEDELDDDDDDDEHGHI